MPVVNDPKEYGDRWTTWWWSMEPSWRDPELPSYLPSEIPDGSWSNMLCGGPNGLLLVVIALAWWMKYRTEADSSLIKEAALDVTWVLGQLRIALDVQVVDKGKNRVLEDDPAGDLRSSKWYLIF